ncbi:hypothetical protein [Sporosarcina sp. FSL K6-1508]|uniref:hypothetical protein n=1 Tax=Sporosarcina sp. FSL K6-1508 TaxID=2921553 RepID=UPI0030F81FA1
MVTAIVEEKVSSLFFLESNFFANNILLEDFDHMQTLLGGDCIALALPCDILLWYPVPGESRVKHTLTIQQATEQKIIYGNCLLTSNDEESLNGIRSLSANQRKWLGDNHSMVESEISGEYVIKFITN